MNIDFAIGIFSLAFGCFSLGGYGLLALGRGPKLFFGKLEPMRERYGWLPGTAIHFTAYVAVPILAGIVLLTQAL